MSENIIAVGEYDFYRPQGFAVNNNPESPFFGTVYITNAAATSNTDKYEGAAQGVYVFDPLYTLQGSYTGGITWGSASPHRLFIDENDLIYASNWGENGGIYIMDPANPTADFKSLLDPAQRGVNYTQITGFDIIGTGADRILVACDGVNYSGGSSVGAIVKFAIGATNENFAGAADTIATAASLSLGNNNNTIADDGRGGYWIYQNRGSEGGLQCLAHITADGTRDYRSYTDGLGIPGSGEGALALNADKTQMAISVNGPIYVFDIAWGEDGKPVLTKKYETAALGNKVNGIVYDYANNLVAGTRNTERLGVFALPSDNVITTPAPKANTITVEAAAPQPTELWLTPNWGEITAGGEMFAVAVNFDIEVSEEQLAKNLTIEKNRDDIMIMGLNPFSIYVPADAAAGQLMVTVKYGELEAQGAYTIIPAGPQGISITPNTDLEIESLGTLQLEAMLYPEGAEYPVIWWSSDETLATVSSTGLVTSLVTEQDTTVQIFAAAEGFEGIEAYVDVKLLAAEVAGLTFELNGGAILPTNEALWEIFKPAYNTYYGLGRADQPIDKVSTFAAAKMVDFMTNEASPWKWLGDYVMPIAAAQGFTLDATSGESAWRWTIHAFFNCSEAGTLAVQVAGFTEAGQPSAWVSACTIDLGLEPTFESVPVKEGYTFTGWYTDEACTTLATEAPETGVLYAGWDLQGLNGVYTVGGEGADFASLAEAAARVNAKPIEGDVTLAIAADLTETTNSGVVNTTDYVLTVTSATETQQVITFTSEAANAGPAGSFVVGSSDPVTGANEVATKNVIVDNLAFVHKNAAAKGRLVVYGATDGIILSRCSSTLEYTGGTHEIEVLKGASGAIPANTIIRGCTITGKNTTWALCLRQANGAIIEDCIFDCEGHDMADFRYSFMARSEFSGNGIFRGNKVVKILDNGVKGVAVVSLQGGNWIVENNYFAGMSYTAETPSTSRLVYIRPIVPTIVRHNTFYVPELAVKPTNADNQNVCIENGYANLTVENNIFVSAEPTAQHAFLKANPNVSCQNNVFYHVEGAKAGIVGSTAWADYAGNTTNVWAEVHFTDAAAGDLSLAPESDGDVALKVPAIAEVTTDITGATRHADYVYAGAYEGGEFKEDPTALENTEVENANVRKVFENGNVYIIRGGKKYTITGIVVE